MGLSISMQIVKMMGSMIEVDSSPGKGSCFFFTLSLPAAEQQEQGQHAVSSADKETKQPIPNSRQLSVLLVDDVEANRILARHLMEQKGWHVCEAVNGQEALDRITEKKYDVVLMDVEMPVMNGIEATKQLRRQEAANGGSHLPVIAMTAHALQGDRERMLASGMDDYVSKPLILDEFFKAIDRQLR